jgi:hypothetical protein
MEDNKNNVIKQATNTLDLYDFMMTINLVKEYIPGIAKFAKQIYDEYKKVGFTDAQSFEITKDYIIKLMIR